MVKWKYRRHTQRSITRLCFYAFTFVTCFAVLFPIMWMVVCSLKDNREIFSASVTLLPRRPQWSRYLYVLTQYDILGVPFRTFIYNSLKVVASSTLFSVVISALGGYALSRFRFCGRSVVSQTILLTQMLPATLIVIPIYLTLMALQVSPHIKVGIAYTTFGIPFCTWMIRGFFDSIPTSLDEAAMIDGCSRLGAFVRVVLPLACPGIVATTIFAFIVGWNDYLYASLLLKRAELWTVPLALMGFVRDYSVDWNSIMACSTIITVPVIILFLLLQRYLIAGLTAGSIKG